MNIHKKCSTLSIYSFDRIVETNNLKYLIKDFDEDKEVSLTSEQFDDLSIAFENISNEYNELIMNKKLVKNYKTRISILELEFLYDTTARVLKLFGETEEIEVLGLLVDLKWEFDKEKEIDPQLAKIEQKLKGIKNRIKIGKAGYIERYKKPETKEKSNLVKQALYLEMGLEMKRRINIKKTSVEEWVNLVNISIEKSKRNGSD